MSRFLNERLQSFKAYVPGEQPTARLIKLNTNESPYPPSPKVTRALTRRSIEELRLYSDLGATDLTRALADDLGVSTDQIVTGNGSDEILYFAMLAFGEKGVRFPDITYGFYPVWARLIGIGADVAPLREDFTIDPERYLGNDRMVILANPNAPTGVALGESALRRIIEANPDQVVLVDEAYVDFGAQSAVSWVGEYENLIVCRTFSKSRQMAGARLGFAVAQRPLIQDLDKMRYSINPYNVNSLTQALGAASVRDRDYFDAMRARIIETREWTRAALMELEFDVLPSSANFLFAKPPHISGQQYMRALRERSILVRWFDQDRIRDHVRITIGTDEQMRALIQVTADLLDHGVAAAFPPWHTCKNT